MERIQHSLRLLNTSYAEELKLLRAYTYCKKRITGKQPLLQVVRFLYVFTVYTRTDKPAGIIRIKESCIQQFLLQIVRAGALLTSSKVLVSITVITNSDGPMIANR